MHILNFAHPMTEAQQNQLAEKVGTAIDHVTTIKIHLDQTKEFVPQVVAVVDSLEIDSAAWQSNAWVIVLPALNYIAAILLAELHGRIGYFPTVVRLRPSDNPLLNEFVIAEIINLNRVREDARARR